MKFILRLTSILTLFLCVASAQGQPTISGVINAYTPVERIDDCGSLTVGGTSEFAVGDLVIIMQMQGGVIDGSNTPSYGTVTDYASAGKFEYARIGSITGNTVQLRFNLVNTYSVAGRVQMIKVPEYNDVTVGGVLRCREWDGATGGVLALKASGTVTLQADIDASGMGFRGGRVAVQKGFVPTYQNAFAAPPDSERYGARGEGIAGYGVGNLTGGRGGAANGGGGGGNHNAGGGGGGNAGCGGNGGWAFEDSRYGGDFRSAQGIGGHPLVTVSGRAFLGGGGGAGHDNNSVGTNGGRGGGLILIDATTLDGDGHLIPARGTNALNAQFDGSGGGGGGGSILMAVNQVSGPVTLDAHGGNGGAAGSTSQTSGPGGGGGGGVVAFRSGAIPANVGISSILAGNHGPHIFDGTSYGSADGCIGDTVFNFAIPQGSESCVDTVDWGDTTAEISHYLPVTCAGHTRRGEIGFFNRYRMDTAVAVTFSGPFASEFSLDTTLPFSLTPSMLITIPVIHRAIKPGRLVTIMHIRGSSGANYAIKIIVTVDKPIAGVLDLASIGLGNRTGSFDTCFTVRSTYYTRVTFTGTAWGANSGVFSLANKLPFMVSSRQSAQLCLHVEGATAGSSDTLYLSGVVIDSCNIGRCVLQRIVIDMRSGPPTLGIEGRWNEALSSDAVLCLPNPVRDGADVRFIVRRSGRVRVRLVDIAGREVGVLAEGWMDAGEQRVELNAGHLSTGKYFVEVEGENWRRSVGIVKQ